MKYRPLLKEDLKNIDIASETIDKKKNNWQTQTYKIKVITPIYGGGVNAGELDKDMPIRASAIRGQLRYWWRFLYINDPANKKDKTNNKELFYKNLFIKEREIWGGMGDETELKDSGEKDFSSKVFLKTNNIPKFTKIKVERYTHQKGVGIKYALFPALQGDNDHGIFEPNNKNFNIKISANLLTDNQWKSVITAFKWWACFGGIGARTRRGLGSIEITEVINHKMEVIQFAPLTSDDVDGYDCQLITTDANNAIDAWEQAVKKLQQFRQGNIARNGVHGRSKWPEPDSIRYIVKRNTPRHEPRTDSLPIPSFPRAAFGLPIIFDFVNDAPPQKTELIPVIENTESTKSKMSSPLILKAMHTSMGVKAIALKMPDKHLSDLTICLNNTGESNNNHLPKTFSKGSWWNSKNAQDVQPLKDRGTDALSAFMNFFENGGK